MAGGSDKVLMTDEPLIAYPPIKCVIKLEIPDDENQQVNSDAEEENWTPQVHDIHFVYETVTKIWLLLNIQLPEDPDMMKYRPILAYPPIQRNVKQEMPDELQDVKDDEVDFWKLQVMFLFFS